MLYKTKLRSLYLYTKQYISKIFGKSIFEPTETLLTLGALLLFIL
jgi:hypothetical protein